eukprot:750349-Hanusia_phi.AAC.2
MSCTSPPRSCPLTFSTAFSHMFPKKFPPSAIRSPGVACFDLTALVAFLPLCKATGGAKDETNCKSSAACTTRRRRALPPPPLAFMIPAGEFKLVHGAICLFKGIHGTQTTLTQVQANRSHNPCFGSAHLPH